MIHGKTVLAIIPARGGSKRVPGKNLRTVGGKTLIARAFQAARGGRYIDNVVVSTDDRDIAREAMRCGCEYRIRPAHLATDEASSMDVVFHVMAEVGEYGFVVLLQPTSPLRTSADIDRCIELADPACVSIAAGREFRFADCQDGRPKKDYALNGAVYVARADWLLKNRSFVTRETSAYEMPPERSVDIDTEADFALAEFYIKAAPIKANAEDLIG